MSQSARLRTQELRALFRLIGECRELGDDGTVWWNHYVRGLASLAGADVIHGEEARCGPPRTAGPTAYENLGGVASWGWEGGFDKRYFDQMYFEVLRQGPRFVPMYLPYIDACEREDGVCLGPEELIREADLLRSNFYELNSGMGLRPPLFCLREVPGRPREMCVVNPCRALGSRDFNRRERNIIWEAQRVVVGLLGGPLARFREPSPSALPPRVRQVLKCLLEGDSDKHVATRLGVTRHTVNQYAKIIHRHFGVHTRTELLARWIKRGWGARYAWADES